MVIIKNTSVGVIAKDKLDYQKWVNKQSIDSTRKYFPILTTNDIYQSFDEIIITSTAYANPHYVDIYIKLNGAYAKAKKEILTT